MSGGFFGFGKLRPQAAPVDLSALPELQNSHGGSFVSGLIDAARSGATLPGDVYAGRVDPMSKEGLDRVGDLAGLAMTGGLGGVAKEAGEAVLGSGPIRAFHGSPHDFDRFDIKKLGTGEGAQAYGHGLYFAEREGIARSYRDTLSPKTLRADGAPITDDIGQSIAAGVLQHGTPLDDIIANNTRGLSLFAPDDPNAAVVRQYLERAQELRGRKLDLDSGGHMYEVAIDANPKSFLDFDRPLAGQDLGYLRDVVRPAAQGPLATGPEAEVMRRLRSDPRWNGGWDEDRAWRHLRDAYPDLDDTALQRVADGVERAVRGISAAPPVDMNMTGGNLLRTMTQQHGAAGAAGILHNAGIPGVRYLDAASRYGNDGTRNIVTFGDDLVSIVRKYAVPGAVGAGGAAAALGADNAEAATPSGSGTMASPLGFGRLPALQNMRPEDVAALFGQAPTGAPQGFGVLPEATSGFTGSAARGIAPFGALPQAPVAMTEADAQRLEAGMMPPGAAPLQIPNAPVRPASLPGGSGVPSVPLPPQRPAEFGPSAGEPTDIRPPAAGGPAAAAPAGGAEPSLMSRFLSGIGGNSDLLIGIGSGLMSTPGFGKGFAAGIQNGVALQGSQAAQDLARAKFANEQLKFQQAQRATNATAQAIATKLPGTSIETATALASDPDFRRSFFQGNFGAPDGYLRTPEGGIAPVPGGPKDPNTIKSTSQAQAEGVAAGSKEEQQLLTRPDGSVVAINKNNIGQDGQPVATTVLAPTGSKDALEREQRRQNVLAGGADPNDPRYRDYIISGSLPKENQQLLTAGDKKAIMDGEDAVQSHTNTITQLRRALELSKKAYEGAGAGARALVATNLPGFLGGGSEEALATREFGNVVTGQALDSLKTTFGGAPTEGERKILLDVQGAADQPRALREQIIGNAIAKVEQKLRFEQQRVNDLRGGNYYKPGAGASSGAAPAQPPAGGVARPSTKAEYDALPSGTQFVDPQGETRIKP